MEDKPIRTGDIYRIYHNLYYQVYRVVGVYIGGIGTESLIEMEPLSYDKANAPQRINAFIPPSLVAKMEKIGD